MKIQEFESVSVRFTGDSGDGMQLTGTLFAETSALTGNEVATFPDFPSEIRAPQGTVAGVSGFQVQIGDNSVTTPGDLSDVLIAMNPAALKANKKWVKKGGTIIIDKTSITEKALEKAGYASDPFADETFEEYNMIIAPITEQTQLVLADSGLDNKSILRCKNMFALGLTYWIFNKPLEQTYAYLEKKFASKPAIIDANKKVLIDGYNYGENVHALTPYMIRDVEKEAGDYKIINGNTATAWGLLAAAEKSGLELFLGSYPITPATDILHELSKHRDLGAKTMQCEDEIAGICTSIGAAFAGSLAVTTTSGPGLALKGEALGLAIMTELPLVIVDVQRGGPSTGLPTKTEQSDLMQALYGRNGDSPCIVIAASTPGDCFDYAYMACKLALEHMTPVILLTDGFLGNGAQPWKIKYVEDMPSITHKRVYEKINDHTPFIREEKTMSRNWVVPGTPEMMHRIGSLEKDYVTGQASHDPANHQKMIGVRREKVNKVAEVIPDQEVFGSDTAKTLLVGWGGTYGHLRNATENLLKEGVEIAHAHFNYINPLPKNTKELLNKYENVIVAELNEGQFADYLKVNAGIDSVRFNKIQGQPFTVSELMDFVKSTKEEK